MLKQFLLKEISDTLDRKLNIESQLRDNTSSLNEVNEHIRFIENSINKSESVFSLAASKSNDENMIRELQKRRSQLRIEADSLNSLILELQNKLDEIQKVYDYVVKAEQYNNLEKYGKNYIESNDEESHFQMLQIQEFERQRIARDLHDSVVQTLATIVHKVEYVSMVMDKDPLKAKLELKTIEKNTREVISEMRDVIYNLRPMSFDDIGIETTIERELARLQSLSGIKFAYSTKGSFDNIDSVTKITIFRVIQEACNNAIKHSKASLIEVSAECNSDVLVIIVKDNGCGFDFKSIETPGEDNKGFGVSMMKERVYLLSGKITFVSSPDEGTTIKVEVPIIRGGVQ